MSAGVPPTGFPRSELGPGDLSVVIPTRGRPKRLSATLDGLAGQTAHGFETIVVVDGEDEPIPAHRGVRIVQQAHAGPGVARNLGIAHSARRLVLLLGDDMVPSPDLIARHVAQHRAAPADEVAVLGRARWHPDVPDDRLHRWLEWSGALFDVPDERAPSGLVPDAGWGRFVSSNVSLKRAFFEAAGGFDPDFVFDYEDLDLAWRLSQRGLRLVYEPRALTHHLHPYTWPDVVRRYEGRARAERLMAAKHPWFTPWFHEQLATARREPPASRLWPLVVDWVPRRLERLRSGVERRADRHYRQRLAPAFMEAWERAGDSAGAVAQLGGH